MDRRVAWGLTALAGIALAATPLLLLAAEGDWPWPSRPVFALLGLVAGAAYGWSGRPRWLPASLLAAAALGWLAGGPCRIGLCGPLDGALFVAVVVLPPILLGTFAASAVQGVRARGRRPAAAD